MKQISFHKFFLNFWFQITFLIGFLLLSGCVAHRSYSSKVTCAAHSPEDYVTVGCFRSIENDDFINVRDALAARSIESSFEGSFSYRVSVKRADANMAIIILQTNGLVATKRLVIYNPPLEFLPALVPEGRTKAK